MAQHAYRFRNAGESQNRDAKNPSRKLIPSSVTMLGELGEVVVSNPEDDSLHVIPYRPGRILVAAGEREMFVIRPIRESHKIRPDDQTLHAAQLWERFQHRAADGYYNCVFPSLRKPKYAGDLVLIRYLADKGIPGAEGPTWWEHYFDGPEAPAYAPMYSIGSGQFFIPVGPYRVSPEGIVHAED